MADPTDNVGPPLGVGDKPQNPEEIATLWLGRLQQAERSNEKWVRRGRKITRIYRAKSTGSGGSSNEDDQAKFNVFWSNVETLGPATYSRRPKVEVYRRFHDQDATGRLAGMILERAIQYEIDCRQDFHQTVKNAVKDRLLPGLGACWVRYEPSFKKEPQQLPDPTTGQPSQQEIEVLADEFTPVDYVFWEDFLVSPGRGWHDARWVARKLLFLPDALEARFGESIKQFGGDIKDVPCNLDPAYPNEDNSEDRPKPYQPDNGGEKRARIYELWDKESKQLIWLAKGCTVPLDVQDDKAKLSDFFPCPRPLLSTTTNDEFLPVPDYIYYQEQIRELDSVTRRIGILVGSLRLIGVYDATQQDLKTLFSGGMENKMVPVNSWAAFADKGGIKGCIDFVPLDQVAKILQGLYEAREQLKQSVYEITGMADIVRGATSASETLGAQQIKAKFANLRLSSRQQQVAEFVTAILRLKAEIMCDQYSPETLLRISSADQISDVVEALQAAQAAIQQAAQQAQQSAQQAIAAGQEPPPPAAPQPPPSVATLPIVQAALQLLKDEKARSYRIEVASDSMVELDESEQEQRREKFMSSVSNFFNSMKNIGQMAPEMMPVAMEMLKFVVRGYAVGRSLEASIEDAVTKIKARLTNPPPPVPDPALEVAKVKEAGATDRTKMDNDSREKIEVMKLNADQAQADNDKRHEALMGQMDQRHQQGQEQRQADRDEQAAQREQQNVETDRRHQAMQAAHESGLNAAKQSSDDGVAKLQAGLDELAAEMKKVMEQASKLRKRVPTYDANGDIAEVREEFIH